MPLKHTEAQGILFSLKVKVRFKIVCLNLVCFSVLVILHLLSNSPINQNKIILLNSTKSSGDNVEERLVNDLFFFIY